MEIKSGDILLPACPRRQRARFQAAMHRFIATFARNGGLQKEPLLRPVIWCARTVGHYCTNHQQYASSGEAIMAPEGKRRGGPASGKDDFDGRDFSQARCAQ